MAIIDSVSKEAEAVDFAPQDAVALFGAIVTSSNDAIISKTLSGRIMSWNAATERLLGYRPQEIVGKSVRCLIPADRQAEEDEIIARITRGERIENFETVRLRKDGTPLDVSITVSPVRDRKGKIVGASKIIRDITEKRRAEQQIQGLLREVNHRSKNLLGLAQAIAFQTQGRDIDDFRERFAARLKALADSQDLLIEGRWQGVSLEALIRREFLAFGDIVGTRIRMGGPSVTLRPDVVPTVGMVIHELTTNAAKYGALSTEAGTVDVAWSVEADQFALSWTERGGPVVSVPTVTGYGSKVTSRIIETALAGRIVRDYAPAGLTWQLQCPVDAVLLS